MKPRYLFKLESKEAEAHLIILVGPAFAVLEEQKFDETIGYGFNVSDAPGFQVFVSDNVVAIFEVGFAYTWLKVNDGDATLSATRGALRFGIARAF